MYRSVQAMANRPSAAATIDGSTWLVSGEFRGHLDQLAGGLSGGCEALRHDVIEVALAAVDVAGDDEAAVGSQRQPGPALLFVAADRQRLRAERPAVRAEAADVDVDRHLVGIVGIFLRAALRPGGDEAAVGRHGDVRLALAARGHGEADPAAERRAVRGIAPAVDHVGDRGAAGPGHDEAAVRRHGDRRPFEAHVRDLRVAADLDLAAARMARRVEETGFHIDGPRRGGRLAALLPDHDEAAVRRGAHVGQPLRGLGFRVDAHLGPAQELRRGRRRGEGERKKRGQDDAVHVHAMASCSGMRETEAQLVTGGLFFYG
jgi:hypothetical protein